MTKFGLVAAYDESKHLATVHFERPEACAKCGGCGALTQTGTIVLKADCMVGDWVRVELPEGKFLQATAIVYVIPLIGLLGGLGLGWLLGNGSDGYTLLGAGIGLGVAIGILVLINRRISRKPEWTPRITEVFTDKPDVEQIGCHAE